MDENQSFLLDIQDEFLEESAGFIEQTESCFLELENDPKNISILENILRLAHNLKGSAAAVGFDHLSEFAHQFENLLVEIKQGNVEATPGVIDVLLSSNDILRTFVSSLQDDKSATVDTQEVIDKINEILNEESSDENIAQIDSILSKSENVHVEIREIGTLEIDESLLIADEELKIQEAKDAPPPKKKAEETKKTDDYIRLPLKKIEDLLNDFSEQVILQSSLDHYKENIAQNADSINKTILQLSKLTHELQQTAISLRMLSLKNVFNKMQRTVRDTAKTLGKNITFISEGEETELDKTMIDEISSPLTHLIRNAVDHGIETPEEREKSGKPKFGTIRMKASYKGRYFYLEITDDGKGLDKKRIKEKAIEKKLIKPNQQLSDSEIIDLIFANGFSTHDVATDISGRGVGMDAIKLAIEKLRGTIDIKSEEGKGSIMTIKLPPTLAIFNGIVVRIGDRMYIVPSSEVLEIHNADLDTKRELSPGEEVIKIKDTVYPLLDTKKVLKVKEEDQEEKGSTPIEVLPKENVKNINQQVGNKANNGIVLHVSHNGKPYGLIVDDIIVQQRVVFKNLGRELEGMPGVAGGTILADGKVALILEVNDVIELYKLTI